MNYVIKFQAPFERLKTFSDDPDILLRRAIILQAIIDASNISLASEAKKYELEAKAWIFGNSDYFQKICYEALLEPDFIVKIAKEVIKLNKQKCNLKIEI
ncbi:hypothetical protein OCHUTO_0191 [Orientia chuto str. Dubai]|uniref:Uncharacterized protein n=1 Tax=Orientia chuto str. Dubai TaxID=1359168 RepID=A0A0F3MN67_9RICK|nr:hypothetical protein [Candidatus Orientia mediorientalis]KJV57175.1 hypothetical protein OCHUTO_0191 [Orientia chuto str. Dubai]